MIKRLIEIITKLSKNKVYSNASWIIGTRLVQSLLGFFISLFTARYLGPSNFGLVNYAASVVAFVSPIAKLGFDSVLVREYTDNVQNEGKILGTTILLSLCSSLICIVGVVSFSFFASSGENDTVIVCALYSLMLIFNAFELIVYWFQAKFLSRYIAIVSFVTYLVVSAYKIFLLITSKSIFWFALSYSIDYFIISTSLLIIYRLKGGLKISFSFSVAKRVFTRSKYYILSGLMITIFTQTDRIMIKLMIGNEATGYYSAAVSCASMLSFLYSAIIDAFRPDIFQKKKNCTIELYEKSITRLYSIIVYLSLFQSAFVTFFSPIIIDILYGESYYQSIIPLQIITWYTTFSYYGGAKDVWVLSENKQKYLVWLNLTGALLNIGLNCIMIPLLGISGASIATVFTQFFVNVVMMYLIKPLRYNQALLVKALRPKYLLDFIRGEN